MNVKFAILSTIAIIAASSAVQPALAQHRERGGARFDFAPNYFPMEQANVPRGMGQPAPSNHSVTHASMPKASSILGFDPKMFPAKPQLIARGPRPAPIVQQNVNSNVGFTSAVPMNTFPQIANRGQFGQPLSSSPVVASLPPQASKPQGQAVQQKSFAPASTNSSLNGKINPRRSSNNVSARRIQPARGLAAKPGSPIQSYGSNFYQPGSTVPTGSGFTTHTSVNGVVLYKSTKH